MSISLSEIQNRLRPFLLFHWQDETLDLLVDSDFLNIFNDVANDLNEEAQINLERFYAETGSVQAEDDSYTNYLLAGDILKILDFHYEADDWEDQYYSYTDDRLILKVSPSSDIQMDVRYIRKCEDLVDPTDEVDLPDKVIPEYVELLKKRLLIDYGTQTSASYENALVYYGEKAYRKMKTYVVDSLKIRRFWFRQMDDDKYVITKNYISLDNFVAGVDDNFTYIS